MFINFFINNKLFCRNVSNFLFSWNSLRHRIPKLRFFSDSIHYSEDYDRFRHVESSYKPEFDYDSSDLYFDVDTSSKNKSNNETSDNPLKNYSLEHVESAIMQFVPDYISSIKEDSDTNFMTPGQTFFLENKDKLMEIVRKRYYEEKLSSGQNEPEEPDEQTLLELLDRDYDEESLGYQTFQTFPPRDKELLWDYHGVSEPVQREPIELNQGVMPTIDQIVNILEQERIVDVKVMDMDKFERRDQGLFIIIATGTTGLHCRRVGRMLYNIISDLEIPFVSKVSYCCRSRNDEWIIAHLGPLSVHLMTKVIRNKYSLEELLSEHFSSKIDPTMELLSE